MIKSDQLEDPRLLTLQLLNFRRPTMRRLWSGLFETEGALEPKKELAEIESLSYFEIFCKIKLIHLIPPLLEESQ